MKRRTVLAAAGLSLSSVVAGCLGGADDGDDGPSDDDGTNGADAGTDDGDAGTDDGVGENDTDDEYVDDAGNVPADVLGEYYEAALVADIDAVNDLIHGEMPGQATNFHLVGGNSDVEVTSMDVDVLEEGVDEDAHGVEPTPDGETDILVRATPVFRDASGNEQALEDGEEVVLVTEDGEWRLWDLAGGLFRREPMFVETTTVTGVVGNEGEIHGLRVGVRPTSDSPPLDLTNVVVAYQAVNEEGEPKNLSTVRAPDDATAETNPEDVDPEVVEVDGAPEDRFGVSVVSAENPENLLVDHGDEYELVIETTGEEAHEELLGLVPLESNDQVALEVMTLLGFEAADILVDVALAEVEMPDLDGLDPGEEVEL